ncbi:MAG: hypothetical protein B9S33_21125 [Pedosphaera sp. Tous-C6FEB]|nr:MAG: hypothetical protein B9S33_21125 [Pedosphaera sp. Tous-C6FEB]
MKSLLLSACVVAPLLSALGAPAPPRFQEVLDLVRTNLGGVTQPEFERAALDALLRQFDGKVQLDEPPPTQVAAPTGPAITKSSRLDGAFGYLRLSHVSSKLGESIQAEFAKLSRPEPLQGLLLDLRYAHGADLRAAAHTVDLFVATPRVLLTVAGEPLRATAKTNAIQIPTAILVNRHTTGAAEVLAALLRQNHVGLLIGTATPGGTGQFKEFTLSTGQRLRIATGETKLGDGVSLPASGLKPDIAVSGGADSEERAFYAEPYSSRVAPANVKSPARLNEAELVRRLNAGENLDAHPSTSASSIPTKQVRDPVLARALDLLKGLAVVRSAKP